MISSVCTHTHTRESTGNCTDEPVFGVYVAHKICQPEYVNIFVYVWSVSVCVCVYVREITFNTSPAGSAGWPLAN